MSKDILIKACQDAGRRPLVWTQATGGEISFKENDQLLIKASGVRFDEVTRQNGLSALRLTEFRERTAGLFASPLSADQNYLRLLEETTLTEPGLGIAPHAAGFHALLPEKWVVHYHSLAAILMAHEHHHDPGAVTKWLSKYWHSDVTFIDHETSGWPLTARISEQPQFTAYIIRNNGVVLQSDDEMFEAGGLIEEWEALEKKFCQHFGYADVLTLSASRSPVTSAIEMLREMPTGPMRAYLPDTKAYMQRLLAVLEKNDDEYKLLDEAWEKDRDACEIWLATQILYKTEPDLDEI